MFKKMLAVVGLVASSVLVATPSFATGTVVPTSDQGLQPIATYTGHISWSIDGAAEPGHTAGATIPIRFDKPAGATVFQAWFISGDGGTATTAVTFHKMFFSMASRLSTHTGRTSPRAPALTRGTTSTPITAMSPQL